MSETIWSQEEEKLEYNERWLETGFVNDTIDDLFDDEKECDWNFLYMWKHYQDQQWWTENWAYYYNEAVKSQEYYEKVTLNEVKIFQKYYTELKKYIEDKWIKKILEQWPWRDNKLVWLLLSWYDLSWKTIVPIDITPEFLERTERAIELLNEKRLQEGAISPEEQIKVYTELKNRFVKEVYERNEWTVVNVWWSIGNTKSSKNSEMIRTVSDWQKKRHMLISYFNLPESDDEGEMQKHVDDTLKMYDTPEMKERVMKWYEALWLDVSKLEYAVEYVKGAPDMIKMGAKVRKWESLTYQSGWKKLTKTEWDPLRAITSRRYKKEEFNSMVKDGNAKVIETYREWPLSLAVVETIPKSKLEIMKEKWKWVSSRAKNALGALLLVAWSVGATVWYLDHKEEQRYQETINRWMDDLLASREPSSYSNYIKRHSIEGKKELFKVEFDKLLSLLTTRYGNEIREDDIIVLMQEFAEWIDSHNYKPHSANRNEAYWFSKTIDRYSFCEEFLLDIKNTLNRRRINVTPNPWLIKYEDEVRNSYRYSWERVIFSEVDKVLEQYVTVSGLVGGMWIKEYNGVRYMVYKNIAWKYELSKTLGYPWDYSSYIIIDLVRRGEVGELSKQIREFINLKYWTGVLISLNGDRVILKYLTDLYAEWFDLQYLLWPEYSNYNNRSSLNHFVLSYLLPDVWKELQTWGSRMHIDFEKLKKDFEKSKVDLHAVTLDVIDFLESYTWIPDPWLYRSTESEILRLLMQTWAAEFIQNDDQMIRCWVTDYREELNKLWYRLPTVPVEDKLSDSYTDTKISAKYIKHWPVDKKGSYTLVNWDVMNIWELNTRENFWRLVAQTWLNDQQFEETLNRKRDEFCVNKFGKKISELKSDAIYYGQTEYEEIVKNSVRYEISQKLYTSDNMNAVLYDYQARKKAQERYEQLK